MRSQPSFDPLGLLRALGDGGVRFVVIGGFAAQLHGSPSVTVDLDICPAPERENLDRLAAVLIDLEVRLRDAPEGLPFRIDGRTLAAGDWFTFQTRLGMLDILQRPTGDLGYSGLAATAVAFEIDGRRVQVAALDDVIAMKAAAGRPKDRVEIEVLGALRDELDRQGPT